MKDHYWHLTCLLCGHTGTGLVAMQQHLIDHHDVPQKSFQMQERHLITTAHYEWSIRGVRLMRAERRDLEDV